MRLDPPLWERIQTLFHEAAELPESERRAFLEERCGDDRDLIAEVLSLLDADSRDASLLSRSLGDAARQVLGNGPSPDFPVEGFGQYRIHSLLGEGGMGVVYLAERTDLGSMVAIKLLRDAWLSPARRERFANEQRTLAQLNHPSIARLYDANTLADGTPWFVMEYVQGVPITEHCRTRDASLIERLRLFRAVCEAVQHAHSHAVIHRDLKPSNILVTENGTVKLLDFGIAKQLETEADETRTGLRLMTPAYAAPEQRDGGPLGTATDVYSLGVILFELLAGELPTPDAASLSARARRKASQPIPMVQASPRAWPDLDVLCGTAMHQDPARRYRTVEALIRDIDHYLAGEPLEARPDSLRYRMGKFVRRNWREVAAAAVVLVSGLGLVVFYTVRLTTARNAAVAQASRSQRIQRFMLNLFQGDDPAVSPPDSLRVLTIVDRGLREAGILDAEPAVQSELIQALSGIYERLGNLGRADSLLQSVLQQRRSRLGPVHPDVATSLIALGLLRLNQARYEEAEQLIREGLDQSRRTLPATHPVIAAGTAALGKVLEERGAYAEAITTLELAVRLNSGTGKEPASPDLASSLTELANSHFYAGHYAESDSLNRLVLAMNSQLYGNRHPLIADGLVNLGATQFERGHYVEAENLYRQALGITSAWYGKDHYETASKLTMLGRALVYEARYDEAYPVLQQALAIQERVFGPVHPRVASALNELGSVAVKRGKLDEAEADYTRIGKIYHAIYGDEHYLIGIAQSNLGGVYMGRKQFAKAEALYRDAVARFSATQGPEHLNTGIARIKLGRSLLRQNRYAEAVTESLTGYDILMKQTNPVTSFLQAARTDLIAEYDALKQADKATRFRTELAELSGAAGVPPAKP